MTRGGKLLVDGGACWQSSYMRRRPCTKSLARHPGSSPKIHTTKIINIITNNIFRDAFPHRLLPLKGHGAGSVHVFFLVKGSPVGLTKITTSPDWSTRHPRWGPRCCWCQLSYAIKQPLYHKDTVEGRQEMPLYGAWCAWSCVKSGPAWSIQLEFELNFLFMNRHRNVL